MHLCGKIIHGRRIENANTIQDGCSVRIKKEWVLHIPAKEREDFRRGNHTENQAGGACVMGKYVNCVPAVRMPTWGYRGIFKGRTNIRSVIDKK